MGEESGFAMLLVGIRLGKLPGPCVKEQGSTTIHPAQPPPSSSPRNLSLGTHLYRWKHLEAVFLSFSLQRYL